MTDRARATTMERRRYFAYGSNMLSRRLTAVERAPSARAVGVGYLSGRNLRFDKISRDGSGKCDAELTERSTDRVYGVVFEILATEKAALDRLEGAGDGYAVTSVRVTLADRAVDAFTYVALRKAQGLVPYDWYKALVVAGAIEHGLPAEYVVALQSVIAVEDADQNRRRHYETLLEIARREMLANE